MSKKPRKRGTAVKLLLLLIICFAPLVGALFVYQSRDNLHFVTKNAGTFVQPMVSLETIGAKTPEQRRWWLTYYTPEVCDEACIATVEYFNTIQKSLPEDQHRLGILLITPNDYEKRSLPQYQGYLLVEKTHNTDLPEQLFFENDKTGIWIVDPLGNIALRYDVNALDNRMLLDLRHLLKVSKIG